MHATLPLLEDTDFPPLTRGALKTLQVNLGYLCNQQCQHCHVNAGPRRREVMTRTTIDEVLAFIEASEVETLDLTGGAPELNPHFRYLVRRARGLGVQVIDRCNLTVLEEPGQEDLAAFLADNQVQVTASLPCYLEENVDSQRGKGVFDKSISALRRLNRLGYGRESGGRLLNLVYNPQGPNLPPSQCALEQDYKRELDARFGIRFNQLLTLTNMPIQRFGSMLISTGQFDDYMELLRTAYREENLSALMCRYMLSVDWRGYVYDCDFNQMLGLAANIGDAGHRRLVDLYGEDLHGRPITIADHCYGCAAGRGSSCGGALID